MTTINNTFRSKVMKAAHTSFRNGKSKTWSQALMSAWAWAKRTLIETAIDISNKIVRETEKALSINVTFFCYSTDQSVTRMMWIPKSLVNNGNVAPWFFEKKLTEMKAEFSYYGASLGVEY